MLGELLIAAGAIERDQLEIALVEQKNWGGPLGAALVRMGMLDEQTLVRALASQLSLPVMKLEGKRVAAEILEAVPVALAEKHRCLPLLINGQGEGRVLYLGMDDPSDPRVVAELSERLGVKVQPVLVAPTELEEGIRRHYHGTGAADGFFEHPQAQAGTAEPNAPGLDSDTGPLEFADAPAARADSAAAAATRFTEKGTAPPLPSASETLARHSAASNDAMLRAVAQLLVEKGVFTREELVERLKALNDSNRGA